MTKITDKRGTSLSGRSDPGDDQAKSVIAESMSTRHIQRRVAPGAQQYRVYSSAQLLVSLRWCPY